MPQQTLGKEHFDRHVDGRLRFRTYLYFAIAIVLAAIVVYRLFVDGGNALLSVALFVVGLAAGLVFARMFKMSWNADTKKIVSRLDAYGGILLALYVVFEITSRSYLESHFSGTAVLTVVFSLLSGVIIGRGVGMLRRMFQIIRENI